MNIINFKDRRKNKEVFINHNVIKDLEELLKLAKEGKIIGFAGVTLTNESTMRNIYSGDIKGNYLSFMGMLNDLSVELKNHYEEE